MRRFLALCCLLGSIGSAFAETTTVCKERVVPNPATGLPDRSVDINKYGEERFWAHVFYASARTTPSAAYDSKGNSLASKPSLSGYFSELVDQCPHS